MRRNPERDLYAGALASAMEAIRHANYYDKRACALARPRSGSGAKAPSVPVLRT
jgi:mevalonate pyrophosphate decarboxylase